MTSYTPDTSNTPDTAASRNAQTSAVPMRDPHPQGLDGEILPAVAAGEPGSELSLKNGAIRRSILPGGIRVITEKMPGVYSATLGLWVPRGSRDETPSAMGATHFLEHLLFKGTPSRCAKEIAQVFDQIGGHANASTSKETTHYYATVIGEELPLALDCMLDMFRCASLDEKAFELERGVILEELAMDLDDGAERAHDAFAAQLFANHPLGRPVGGTIETVRAATLDEVKAHYVAGYTPDQLVVSVAGDVNHDQVCEQILKAMQNPGNSQWEHFDETAAARNLSQQISAPISGKTLMKPGKYTEEGNFEQAYLVLGGPGIPCGDYRELTLQVMRAILGAGMSSRLFQHIREDRGLAYNTYAFNGAYREVGIFGLAASCNPQNAVEVMRLMREELELIGSEPVTEEELRRAKGQLRGSTLLVMERTSARANHLAHAEIKYGKFIPVEQRMELAQRVTAADILDLARELAENAQVEVSVRPA
ncbi:M16 family metallopeptidase [Mobiluncus mulieris]|uniref:Insulinase family protein n=1 Tax=Mobiluncus mulieris TaxID=2052 RepID=A0A7Y0URK6_9ACTO|nr:pitrilysin family protein [Mobiluncus mulieris]NMX02431.1 insulinase family protein [Mobiluncus mulieris]NMX11492.1 insulinase family protein [Mobiluncus mulieris]